MSNLKSTLETLASQFAMNILSALRSASIEEVMGVTSAPARGGSATKASTATKAAPAAKAAAPAKRGSSRPKKAAVKAAATPAVAEETTPAKPAKKRAAGRPGRLPRRSEGDIGQLIESIVGLVQQYPDGLRAEQIRVGLGVEAKELPRPLADAVTAGVLTKSGQKRATTYFAAAPAGRGKKRGR